MVARVGRKMGRGLGRVARLEGLDPTEIVEVLWVLQSLAGGPGFEPRLTESESAVLPLNYFPKRLLVGDDITELAGEGKRIVS